MSGFRSGLAGVPSLRSLSALRRELPNKPAAARMQVPPSAAVRGDQNGFTMTRITTTTMMAVGTSFIARQ
jgi:hypothetical protein